ncbi:MAG: Phosphoserine phosphatase RsbU [Syntrophaceae bacterium PtaU1.Bin231]|nr:MAG: Phosphoserine phosphatase RsbU [Syntrophaceae bacterium PtaU1.Bin231]
MMDRIRSFLSLLFRTGHGRPMAAAVLAVFALIVAFPDASPLKAYRLDLFDAYQSYLPRQRQSAPVVIVGIDEASLKRYGQWPWPRTRLAELIDRLMAGRPAAIGIDIIMPEPDRSSPARMAASLPQVSPALRRSLSALPDNDRILAAALAGRPVVLGAAGFDDETPTTARTMRTAPVTVKGGDAGPHIRRYPAVLKSLPELEEASAGQAVLSADLEMGIVRRVLMVAAIGDVLAPTLSVEMLRVAGGLPSFEISVGPRGITSVGVGDIRIPTQADGEAWVNFTPFMPERYISAADVLAGRVNPDMIERKLVLIGLTGQGLLDYPTTPHGERIPGIEVHAQLIENIFDGSYLRRPAWMPAVETAVVLILGVLLLMAVPALKPKHSIALAAVITAVLITAGFLLYRSTGLLFDAASSVISFDGVFAVLLGSVYIETDRARRLTQQALQAEREAAARVAGELDAARRVQMGSLPQAAGAFPGETRFDLDAFLSPAREVGGDLYDFYMLDDRRLFFIVGDVSGKGLPASLFMVMTKALTKSMVTGERTDFRGLFDRLNGVLCRENPEMLFVTAVAAVLDVEIGRLAYCVAGHEAPWHIDAAGAVEQLAGEDNPPLSVFEDAQFRAGERQLASGDAICIITDGITEAMDAAGGLYGEMRFTELLRHQGGNLSAPELLSVIRNDVRAFVDGAEQSDDLTLLVVRWYGPRIN